MNHMLLQIIAKEEQACYILATEILVDLHNYFTNHYGDSFWLQIHILNKKVRSYIDLYIPSQLRNMP